MSRETAFLLLATGFIGAFIITKGKKSNNEFKADITPDFIVKNISDKWHETIKGKDIISAQSYTTNEILEKELPVREKRGKNVDDLRGKIVRKKQSSNQTITAATNEIGEQIITFEKEKSGAYMPKKLKTTVKNLGDSIIITKEDSKGEDVSTTMVTTLPPTDDIIIRGLEKQYRQYLDDKSAGNPNSDSKLTFAEKRTFLNRTIELYQWKDMLSKKGKPKTGGKTESDLDRMLDIVIPKLDDVYETKRKELAKDLEDATNVAPVDLSSDIKLSEKQKARKHFYTSTTLKERIQDQNTPNKELITQSDIEKFNRGNYNVKKYDIKGIDDNADKYLFNLLRKAKDVYEIVIDSMNAKKFLDQMSQTIQKEIEDGYFYRVELLNLEGTKLGNTSFFIDNQGFRKGQMDIMWSEIIYKYRGRGHFPYLRRMIVNLADKIKVKLNTSASDEGLSALYSSYGKTNVWGEYDKQIDRDPHK